ncbi:ABC transporter permease [Eubacteriales bacterium OttesenSCG-928-N14]|nr:ABC transporter permease [Eubacteriales bacterium OttesenSCG-928-N14]
MKTTLVFSSRNTKELLRDPLNLAFALGFPVVVMLLLTFINNNIPQALFAIEHIAPGMAVFGLSFISLFSGTLIAKDRGTSFLMRLFASPMESSNFILGYALPLLPLALAQSAICYLFAMLLGLPISIHILPALLLTIPAALFFIGIGLLCGSLLTDKQVGGICGALLTNLTAWLSGTWFDLSLVGGAFETVANLLPFSHAVELGRAALAGNYAGIFPHIWWVLGYAAISMAVATLVFRRKMKSESL